MRFSFLTDPSEDDNDVNALRYSGSFAHNTGAMYLTEFSQYKVMQTKAS